jgi:hypothetical protein
MSRAVAIPALMQHLPRDERGYAIPCTVLVDSQGKAHFAVNDELKRQQMLREDRCTICGHKLLRGRWSVGGPLSLLDERGALIDPPMHYECSHYALRVCPYIAAPNYSKRVDAKTVPKDEALIYMDPTEIPRRPDVFIAVMHIGQTFHKEGRFIRFIRPNRPFRQIEYWRQGTMLDPVEGKARAERSMQDYWESAEGKEKEMMMGGADGR